MWFVKATDMGNHIIFLSKAHLIVEQLLELVHTNLMGPTRISSYRNCHYVMVLVDDYSRYTWTYVLKEKNEALSKFVEFWNMVEKELGQKVKCLQSDNGGEIYVS